MPRDAELIIKVDMEELTKALDAFSVRFAGRLTRIEEALQEYDSHFDDKFPTVD